MARKSQVDSSINAIGHHQLRLNFHLLNYFLSKLRWQFQTSLSMACNGSISVGFRSGYSYSMYPQRKPTKCDILSSLDLVGTVVRNVSAIHFNLNDSQCSGRVSRISLVGARKIRMGYRRHHIDGFNLLFFPPLDFWYSSVIICIQPNNIRYPRLEKFSIKLGMISKPTLTESSFFP